MDFSQASQDANRPSSMGSYNPPSNGGSMPQRGPPFPPSNGLFSKLKNFLLPNDDISVSTSQRPPHMYPSSFRDGMNGGRPVHQTSSSESTSPGYAYQQKPYGEVFEDNSMLSRNSQANGPSSRQRNTEVASDNDYSNTFSPGFPTSHEESDKISPSAVRENSFDSHYSTRMDPRSPHIDENFRSQHSAGMSPPSATESWKPDVPLSSPNPMSNSYWNPVTSVDPELIIVDGSVVLIPRPREFYRFFFSCIICNEIIYFFFLFKFRKKAMMTSMGPSNLQIFSDFEKVWTKGKSGSNGMKINAFVDNLAYLVVSNVVGLEEALQYLQQSAVIAPNAIEDLKKIQMEIQERLTSLRSDDQHSPSMEDEISDDSTKTVDGNLNGDEKDDSIIDTAEEIKWKKSLEKEYAIFESMWLKWQKLLSSIGNLHIGSLPHLAQYVVLVILFIIYIRKLVIFE